MSAKAMRSSGARRTSRGANAAGRAAVRSAPRRAAAASSAPLTGAELMLAAVRARRSSYSPYSRFAVGAALLGASGTVYHGCNVENASFGLTCCAERNAVFHAVSAGERSFVAIAVTARTGRGAPPCGACRQVLAEFAPDLLVYWREDRGRVVNKRLSALLPDQFELTKQGGKRR